MFFRSILWAGALAGGFAAAQFPAFSQQYVQRLGGAAAALEQVVLDFDASAAGLGLTRSAALDQMIGTAFVEARRMDMERTIARYEKLSHDLATLQEHGPFMRAYHARHFADAELARGTWAAFEPALPLSMASLVFAAFGALVTALGLGAGVRFIWGRFRRRPLPA